MRLLRRIQKSTHTNTLRWIENSVRLKQTYCALRVRSHGTRDSLSAAALGARSLDQHWGCVCRGRHPRRHLTISCPACGASSVALARGYPGPVPLGLRSPPLRPFAFLTPAPSAPVPAPPVFCSSPENKIVARGQLNLKIVLKVKY